MKKYTKQLLNTAAKIKLIATDIDGVLTAGEVIVLESGEEVKIWNVRDRQGLHTLKQYLPEIKTAWITGRKSKQVEIRAKEQKIDFLVQQCKDKVKMGKGLEKSENRGKPPPTRKTTRPFGPATPETILIASGVLLNVNM